MLLLAVYYNNIFTLDRAYYLTTHAYTPATTELVKKHCKESYLAGPSYLLVLASRGYKNSPYPFLIQMLYNFVGTWLLCIKCILCYIIVQCMPAFAVLDLISPVPCSVIGWEQVSEMT